MSDEMENNIIENGLPCGWKRVRLGDICDLSQGLAINAKSKHLIVANGAPLLRITDLINNKQSIFIDYENAPKQTIVEKGDIIYTRTGQVGLVFKNKIGIAHNNTFKVIPKNNVKSDYIYWFLRQEKIINHANSIASGSVQKDLNHSAFKSIFICLPTNISEQQAIANVLSSIDDKIESNNKINKKLEEIAQTLFKQWFIDFDFPNEEGKPYKSSGGKMVDSEMGKIPKDWEVVNFGECVEFINGYAFKSKEILSKEEDNCFHIFKMGHIKKGGGLNSSATKSWIEKQKCKKLSKYILTKGDLLMCMTDMKGNVSLLGHTALMNISEKYIVNQRVGLIRKKNDAEIYFPYLYLLTNSRNFIEDLRNRANSGVQVNLSTNEILSTKIVISNKCTNKKFNNIAIKIFENIFNISNQNTALASLRQALLPKLMSGEIRVPIEK